MAILSHLYTVAIKDWGMVHLKGNPVFLIRKPEINNARYRRIHTSVRVFGSNPIECPLNELEWISKRTRSKLLPTIMTLAVETGLRRSELTNIKREHIDFEQGVLFIPESKNGTSRAVPLSPLARYILVMYLTKNNNKGKIFKISPSSITRSFLRNVRLCRIDYEQLCEKYDVEPNPYYFSDLRFHDLRHEATSRLAEVYEMHELAKITGHKDTRMLLRYYHPDTAKMTNKLAQSEYGQHQFSMINNLLLNQKM